MWVVECELGWRHMCGIAGITFKNGGGTDLAGRALIDMLDGCQHRGPDSTGVALYDDALEGEPRVRTFVGEGAEADQSVAPIKSALAKHSARIVEDERMGSKFQVRASFGGDVRRLAYDCRAGREGDLDRLEPRDRQAGRSSVQLSPGSFSPCARLRDVRSACGPLRLLATAFLLAGWTALGALVPVGTTEAQSAPSVISIQYINTPAIGDTYRLGENIAVRVTFDKAVRATGTLALRARRRGAMFPNE